ncbi:MAG: hypothetical protein GW947_03205 [Candidatus Pacebacteria bacterium]|nr:hypothetical protein [Candidatus Paceibacterota bacterium]
MTQTKERELHNSTETEREEDEARLNKKFRTDCPVGTVVISSTGSTATTVEGRVYSNAYDPYVMVREVNGNPNDMGVWHCKNLRKKTQ